MVQHRFILGPRIFLRRSGENQHSGGVYAAPTRKRGVALSPGPGTLRVGNREPAEPLILMWGINLHYVPNRQNADGGGLQRDQNETGAALYRTNSADVSRGSVGSNAGNSIEAMLCGLDVCAPRA